MILVHLAGGLGNQLFQYAAGRALAHRHQSALKLVTRVYRRSGESRSYKLHHYNIVAAVATPSEELRIKLSRPWRYLRSWHQRPWIAEPHFHFAPEILQAPDDVGLEGCWQSEKYFHAIEPLLRRELTLRPSPGEDNVHLCHMISRTNSISLHVRRGDYVSNPISRSYHGCLSLEYYSAAVDRIIESVESPHFFVFSDDMDWVQQHLHTGYPTTFVRHNATARDFEDLRLMSQCRHHIIANSSFSWWGAWLGSNPHKRVIAPRNWFDGAEHDTRDLIPDSWERIQA